MDYNFSNSNYNMYSDAPHALGGGNISVPSYKTPVNAGYNRGMNTGHNVPNQTESISDDPKAQWYDRQIAQLQEEYQSNTKKIEELNIALPKLKEKYAPKAMSDKDIESKLAANRARRIKKDNETLNQWRWKKEQDLKEKQMQMNSQWQSEQNHIEDELGRISNRNEFNARMNTALENLMKVESSGNAMAIKLAEENVNGLMEYGKTAFGIDMKDKVAQFREANKTDQENIVAYQKKLDGFKNKVLNVSGDGAIESLRDEIQNSDLEYKDKNNLLAMEQMVTQKQMDQKAKRGAKAGSAGSTVSEQDKANKLTLDELLGKSSLNQWEEAALDSKYPVSQRQSDADIYNALSTSSERKNWAKRNPGKLDFLKKKGLVK